MTTTDVRPQASAIPEIGQLVDVRGSRWIVTDVTAQGLPRSSADDTTSERQHAVTLQAIGDDRYGEELRVLWEIEAGTALVPEQGLPKQLDAGKIDDPSTLAAFIDALRWGAVTSADPTAYQAPFRSGATLEPYQLEPLRRALSSPRTNLLLADDVGLGKTIEAGLVVQELLLRHRARSAIVVCPAGLVVKWQEEMQQKFGLAFEVVNSESMRDVRRRHGVHANPFTLFPRVIVSMSWLPTARAQRLLQAAFEAADRRPAAERFAFDISIVDEAHHVAPSTPQRTSDRRAYATDSQRTVALRDLSRRCEHRLFLTATPHNGYTESFTALLEMIDPNRFARGADVNKDALAEVAVRRLKANLNDARFKGRKIDVLPYSPADDEIEAHAKLVELLARRQRQVKEAGAGAADLGALVLKKRFLSSPWAFALSARTYLNTRHDGRELEFADYDELLGENAADYEEGRLEQPELEALSGVRRTLPDLNEADAATLKELINWGASYEARADSRLTALIQFLDAITRPDGTWINARVVIFTEYVDTLEWIERALRERGYDASRLSIIHGQTPTEDREDIRLKFNADPSEQPIRILLATDAAGEGIDLQEHCHRLVNFDIPFNPNRLEQRIGRIDRYGQQEVAHAWHFGLATSQETSLGQDFDILKRVADKIQRVRQDLGSANDVLAPDIERELLGKAARPHRAPQGGSEQAINTMLAGDREMSVVLTRIADELEAARGRLHLLPGNIQRVVNTALALDRQPLLAESVEHPESPDFLDVPRNLSRPWEVATRDLPDPLTHQRRAISFSEVEVADRGEVVHAHLGHPLVQLATRTLRAELWTPNPRIHKVTAVVVPGLKESVVAAVARLVLVGGSGIRLHEEVFLAGTRLARRQDLGEDLSEDLLAAALDGETLEAVPHAQLQTLVGRWNSESDDADGLFGRVTGAVQARAGRRLAEVQGDLDSREKSDVQRVEATFARFRTTLVGSIERMEREAQVAAETLFELDDSARQRARDIREVRVRLDVLDDERDREIAGARSRYLSPTAHTFAGALIFALSTADAEGLSS